MPMTQCLTPEIVERYVNGTLDSPEEMLALDAHLDTCAACRDALRTTATGAMQRLPEDLTPLPGEVVCLDEEMLSSYVDDKADAADREIVETHLAECRRCAEDVADLRTFRAALANYDPSAARAIGQPPSLWKRLREWFAASSPRRVALHAGGFAAAAAAGAWLTFWMTTRPMRVQLAEIQTEMERMQRSNAALREEQSAEIQRRKQDLADLERRYRQEIAALQNHSTSPQRSPEQVGKPFENEVAYALNDAGTRVTVNKTGSLQGLSSLPRSFQQTVESALRTQRAEIPMSVAALNDRSHTVLGGGDKRAAILLGPIGTLVQSDRPTFRWKPISAAAGNPVKPLYAVSYTITVVNDTTNKREAQSVSLPAGTSRAEMEWKADKPLSRQVVCRWFVTATFQDGHTEDVPGASDPLAKFEVMESAEADRLARKKQLYGRSHLALGVLYGQSGLLEDAQREFKVLLEANPTSPVVRRLLDSVRPTHRK
jgi:anti-sigma factor RsiW